MAFTAEFCAYAAAHGRDPEAQIHADRAAWPGGVMTGFILWCDRLLFVFRREHPEAFIGPHVADHSAKVAFMRDRGAEFVEALR